MSSSYTLHTISLFPMMFDALNVGITGRALREQRITLHHHNPRDYSDNRHGYVDDRPFGGGPGMILSAPALQNTLEAIWAQTARKAPLIFFSPHGAPLKQQHIHYHRDHYSELILLAGRYEGVDQRFIEHSVDYHYALGECVLSGGEIPTLYFIDALTRTLPGALHNPNSLETESFNGPCLDHAHYTRPQHWQGYDVPEPLITGHHQNILTWRCENAHFLTHQRRPELIAQGGKTKCGKKDLAT